MKLVKDNTVYISMKIGYQGSKSGHKLADYIFSTYHEKILDPNAPLKLINTKSIRNGLLYPIDAMCMRTYYPKHKTEQTHNEKEILTHYYRGNKDKQPLDNTRHRFFECRECTAYKIYEDLVEDGEFSPVLVIKSPNLSIAGRMGPGNEELFLDAFTKNVIINQYLWAKDVVGVLSPVNVFVCGSTGYQYYNVPADVKRKIKPKELVDLYTSLAFYGFSFNSIPKQHIITETGVRMLVPKKANISIGKTRLVDYLEVRSHYPKPVLFEHDDYFVLKTDLASERSKLKQMISLGLLPKRVQISLNILLSVVVLVAQNKMDSKVWVNLFNDDESIDLDIHHNTMYDQLLQQLNDLKIKYTI